MNIYSKRLEFQDLDSFFFALELLKSSAIEPAITSLLKSPKEKNNFAQKPEISNASSIVLCGYQGCGKTVVGKAFSELNQFLFIDTDSLICDAIYTEKNVRRTVREIYQLLGDEKFRALEKKIVRSIRGDENTLVATGGGSLLDPDNLKLLKSVGIIVYLQVDRDILFERMMRQATLPGFIRESSIQEDFDHYIDSRKSLYEMSADVVLDISGKSISQCVEVLNGWYYGQ